jgi:hypothetical protein
MMCNFRPLQTTARWEVLARVPDRCGAPQRLATIAARPGQTVTIPAASHGEAIYARVHGLAVSGVQRLETLVYRAPERHALINGTEVVQVVPGTAEDGLLFDVSPELDYPAPFALSPNVRTISFNGSSATLRIDIYRMFVSRMPKRAP